MASNTRLSLLVLPAEVRNHIFDMTLSDSDLDVDRGYRLKGVPAPGIVFACKQTYHETRDMYYNKVTVVSKDTWILNRWLRALILRDFDEHPFKLINSIKLDDRNRSEQELPLGCEARQALSFHSDLALSYLDGALAEVNKARHRKIDLRVCAVSPSQELVWTATPIGLVDMLEERYKALTIEQRNTLTMEQWAPSGINGIFWCR